MKQYQMFVDYSDDWKEDNIKVMSVVVEADTPEQAHEKLIQEIENGEYEDVLDGCEYYIWEVTEDDVVEDDD